MLTTGPAKKVTIYLGEDVHRGHAPLYLAILNFLFSRRVSGATVIKGVAGFGAHHHMHTSRILEMSENLPIKIEFVETSEGLQRILPELLELSGDAMVDVQDTNVLHAGHQPHSSA
jgi:PII-like signaling protein